MQKKRNGGGGPGNIVDYITRQKKEKGSEACMHVVAGSIYCFKCFRGYKRGKKF